MSITFLPSAMLSKIAPEKLVAKLVTQNLTLNHAALVMLSRSGVLSKKTLETIALKVLKQYKEKYREERAAGASVSEATDEALNEKALLVQRVQNSIVQEIAKEIKSQYRGEYYEWLPSDAEEPDPIHQLNYGKKFQVGVGDPNGEDPGDRFGCKCGMELLVDETRLNL